jgi:hypothetical protein
LPHDVNAPIGDNEVLSAQPVDVVKVVGRIPDLGPELGEEALAFSVGSCPWILWLYFAPVAKRGNIRDFSAADAALEHLRGDAAGSEMDSKLG